MNLHRKHTWKSWLLTGLDALLVTFFTFVIACALFIVPLSFKVFNPIKRALGELDLLDFYYSDIRGPQTGFLPQEDLVLVNIGKLDRQGIAEVISRLDSFKVGVIAMDLIFKKWNGDTIDCKLQDAMLKATDKLVLSTKMGEGKVIQAHPFFYGPTQGYVNLLTEDEPRYSAVRQVQFKKEGLSSFALESVRKFDIDLAGELERRFNLQDTLLINYFGNYERFFRMEHTELMSPSVKSAMLKDKLVLVGDFGATFDDTNQIADHHHTPLNRHGPAAGFPDMAGPLLQANVILMLLNEDFIKEVGKTENQAISLLLTFLMLLPIVRFHKTKSPLFSSAMKLLQIILAFVVLFLCIMLYSRQGIKFDPKWLLLLTVLCVDVLHLYRALADEMAKKLQPEKPQPWWP